MQLNFKKAHWINTPASHELGIRQVTLQTEPNTDFWQRTYYGFQNRNAPAALLTSDQNFTFTTHIDFNYRHQFDQCGLVIYQDAENWFKASIEYETESLSRLGSVVTQNGYSDWATSDITTVTSQWYRLSRRGPDFLIEHSTTGESFQQMRIFHLPWLGETSVAMGRAFPPIAATTPVDFGVYACSPGPSSFTARFTRMTLGECQWRAHGI
jgi:regulation of enolase protein 1 (concanavalin A-like superfamily)